MEEADPLSRDESLFPVVQLVKTDRHAAGQPLVRIDGGLQAPGAPLAACEVVVAVKVPPLNTTVTPTSELISTTRARSRDCATAGSD